MDNPRDLEDRLIDFAVRIINVINALPNTSTINNRYSTIINEVRTTTSQCRLIPRSSASSTTPDVARKMGKIL